MKKFFKTCITKLICFAIFILIIFFGFTYLINLAQKKVAEAADPILSVYDKVTEIGAFIYEGDKKLLTEFNVPENVKIIGRAAFEGCEKLKSINIAEGVEKIGSKAFEGCSALQSIEIPDTVTEIGIKAFEGCENLKSIKIPASVEKIGVGAFDMCDNLKNIEVDPDNKYFTALGNVLFNKSMTKLIKCSPLLEGKYDIPETVQVIDDAAFEGCKKLNSIKVPDSVTDLGAKAFEGCENLKSLEIPEKLGEKLDNIKNYLPESCKIFD